MKIGKKQICYTTLMGIAAFLGLIKVIVYGHFLSPREMGYFSIAITVASYGMLLQLGVMNGLNRELPVCLGTGEDAKSYRMIAGTTLAIICVQLVGLAICCAVLSCIDFKDVIVKKAILLGALMGFSATFMQMAILRLRAEQRVIGFAVLQLSIAICMLFLGALSIQYFSYNGAIWIHVLVNLIGFVVVTKLFLPPITYGDFHLRDILYLMRIGLPLMVSGMLFNLQLSMDRLFLIKKALPEQLGIYQIGILPLTGSIIVVSIVSQYVSPLLLFRYGQGYTLWYIYKRRLMASGIIIVAMLSAWYFVLLALSYLATNWIPAYKESLPIISIFYLGAIFTSSNFSIVFNAANRQILGTYSYAIVLCFCFAAYFVVSKNNMPIKFYAYVNVAGQIMVFVITTGLTFWLAKRSQFKRSNIKVEGVI